MFTSKEEISCTYPHWNGQTLCRLTKNLKSERESQLYLSQLPIPLFYRWRVFHTDNHNKAPISYYISLTKRQQDLKQGVNNLYFCFLFSLYLSPSFYLLFMAKERVLSPSCQALFDCSCKLWYLIPSRNRNSQVPINFFLRATSATRILIIADASEGNWL